MIKTSKATLAVTLTVSMGILLVGCGAATGGTSADGADSDTAAADIFAMGNDSGDYPNDGECDDVRFQGEGMATVLNTDWIGLDASDCQQLLDAGRIEPNPLFNTPASDADINYGDDTGEYPNDGECDDIRFTGDYASEYIFVPESIGTDATDCRNAVESGEARWQGNTPTPERGKTAAELAAET